MNHIELSRRAMEMLLFGEDEMLHLLKMQYKNSKIISEEKSPVGFFIDYEVDKFKIDENKFNGNFYIGDVNGKVGDLDEVGFVLFIRNGYLDCLECYAYEKLPEDDLQIKLYYSDSGKEGRDFELLKKNWLKN